MRLTIKAIDSLSANGRDVVYWDDDVPRYGLRVKPSGVKSFVIMYRTTQGRARKMTIGRYGAWAPEQARIEAKRLLRLVDQGADPAELVRQEREAITLGQLCDEYMQAARGGMVATRTGQPKKASTLHQDESRISAHIKPLLGDKLVKDLTQAQVRRFFEDVVRGRTARIEATGKKRGKSIVEGGLVAAKRSVGLLGGMITHAIRHGYRPEGPNPTHGIGMPADTRRQFRLEPAGWRAYGEAIDAAESEGVSWQAVSIAKLLPLTGCRFVSLRWVEVNFDGRCLRFDPQRVKSGPFRPTGQEALAILRDLRGLAAKRAPNSSFVFPGIRGERDQAYSGFKRAWKRLQLAYSPHCLRHAFASAAEDDCGLHESTVAALLGHSKRGSNVTRSYVLKADATLLAAADRVSRYVWQAMTENSSGAI